MGRVLISAQRLHLDTAFASERGVFFYGRCFWHEAHRRASRPTLQRGSDVLRTRANAVIAMAKPALAPRAALGALEQPQVASTSSLHR
ncbi:hypothetical protein DGM98_10600 [Xanthomonas citri]|nr:hypothetical protein DGM98_10600 [Xanthomonas citri]